MFQFQKKNDKLDALVGASSEFKGDITVQGTLRIDGRFTGNITADCVILSEKGSIIGDITTRCAVIGGRFEGNVKAEEIIEIKPTAHVMGDIHTRKLSVAEGGVFEGRSIIHRDEAKVINLPGKEAVLR